MFQHLVYLWQKGPLSIDNLFDQLDPDAKSVFKNPLPSQEIPNCVDSC